MSEAFHWTCPFCNRDTTVTDQRFRIGASDLTIENAEGDRRVLVQFIVCPNPKCRRFTLDVFMHERDVDIHNRVTAGKCLHHWPLIPSSKAVAFPDYVPRSVLDDYGEACLICNLSPKASATLARRCLQGILRDFWAVKPGRLVDEIDQIKDKTDPLTWQAIDAVRKVGNIGAHMEKDIDVIVDVEPNEAQLLIGLIETLLRDWYVTREEPAQSDHCCCSVQGTGKTGQEGTPTTTCMIFSLRSKSRGGRWLMENKWKIRHQNQNASETCVSHFSAGSWLGFRQLFGS